MTLLYTGLAIFIAVHLTPALPGLRPRLQTLLGENGYKAVYSVIALAGLIVIVIGKGRAPFEPLWTPPLWGRHLAWLAMYFSLLLFIAANFPSNVKRLTQHPMYWGVVVWAAVHLLANGDLASAVLFAAIGIWALVGLASMTWREPAAVPARQPFTKDLMLIVISAVVYLGIGLAHPWLFGAAAFL